MEFPCTSVSRALSNMCRGGGGGGGGVGSMKEKVVFNRRTLLEHSFSSWL